MFKKIIVSLLFIVTLNACGGSRGDPDPQMQELNEARAVWAAQGITDYRMEVQISCYCPPEEREATVIVSGADIEVLSANGMPVSDHPAEISVAILFDQIEKAIDADDSTVEVEYDSTYGYPLSVQFDWIVGAADDEMSYNINLVFNSALAQEVAANKTLWQNQGLDSYQMNYVLECYIYCVTPAGEMSVTVENGAVTSAVYLDGASVDLDALSRYPVTVDEQFEMLERYAHSAWSEVQVVFSAQGYPAEVFIDSNISIHDDQLSLAINDLN